MQKLILLICLAAFGSTALHAQQRAYPIKWEEKPQLHAIPKEFSKASAVFVLDERRAELVTGDDKELYAYRTMHRIIHLTDDKGVESFNRFSLPTNNSTRMVSVKARSITPSGKITEVGREQVKEIKNDEGHPEYLLAVEGIEKGGEVEIMYTEKRKFSYFGSETFQFSIPVMKAEFSLIIPTRIVFDTKGYNGFPAAIDSVDPHNSDNHFYIARQLNIPALKEEQYSNYKANLRRLDYKLSFIKGDKGDVRQLTWSELAGNLYERYYNFTDKENSLADDYILAPIGVKETDDEVTRIQKIEDYLKSNIAMSEDLDEEDPATNAFPTIIKKKLTTESGFVRFFCACLTAAGVKHELGIGSSQYDHPLDDSLELWSGLDIFAIYFPKENQYISPSGINLRYPFYPLGLSNSKVVFCKPTKLGNIKRALPDIRTIPPLPYTMSYHDIDAAITFAPTDLTPMVDITYSFLGYGALGMREIFLYSPKEKEAEMVRGIITLAAKPEDITASSVKNAAYTNYYSGTPLLVNMTLKAPGLMDKAGPKYLLKVGDVIGRQVEMYATEKRVLPVDIQYAQEENRTISITIPQGYKVTNPDAVKMSVTQSYDGKPASGFISTYTMEGNVMKISINEYYHQLQMPASEFEAYRKVINASADFNKVVLVLQKTGG